MSLIYNNLIFMAVMFPLLYGGRLISQAYQQRKRRPRKPFGPMDLSGYWLWLSARGLVSSNADRDLLKKIDILTSKNNLTEAEKEIKNRTYWFTFLFDVPSSEETQIKYFNQLIEAARLHFN